jgi:PII-like signaling protein
MLQDGLLLRIYIAETAMIENKPGYRFLVDYFMKKGFPGCTVFRGMLGYGHENILRTVDILNLSLDLPVVIDVVDTRDKIMAIVPEIEKMVDHGLVMIQQVQMIRKVPK